MKYAVLLTLLLTVCIDAYPTGAPDELCDSGSITPKHLLFKTQELSSLPYTVTASSNTYSSDKDVITVTIKAKNKDKPFRGFAVSAKDGKKLIGQWDDTSKSHPLSCSSIVTHDNRNTKTSVELKWHPPKGASSGTVTFSATIVKKFDTFWANIPVKT